MSGIDSITRDLSDDELALLGLQEDSSSPTALIDAFGLTVTARRVVVPIKAVLALLDAEFVTARRATTGRNSDVFIVTCKRNAKASPRASEQAARALDVCWAGTQPFTPPAGPDGAFRVVFARINPKADQDVRRNIETKVAAMELVRQGGQGLEGLMPKVYAWSNGGASGKGVVWTLMEFMTGVPLEPVFDALPLERKLALLPTMADMFARLQRTPLPDAAARFGSFAFDDNASPTSVVSYGPSQFFYGGPYHTAKELYKGYVSTQLEALRTKAPWVKGWKGYDVPGKGDLAGILERWEAEVKAGLEPVFIHGDYHLINILVDAATLEPTAILDLEFSQSGPPLDEYCQSFGDLGLVVQGTRDTPLPPLSPTPETEAAWQAKVASFQLGQSVLFVDAPADLGPSPRERTVLAQAMVAALKSAGAIGPWSYPADKVDMQANLYWHAQELCSGPIQRPGFWEYEGVPEENVTRRKDKVRDTARGLVRDCQRWHLV